MHRYRVTALALSLALSLAVTACGKDIDNPEFPTALRCSLMDDCTQPAKPATVVRPIAP